MISLLIPCYNEQEVLLLTYETVVAAAPRWGEPVEIVLVDDGSSDATWEIIQSLCRRDPRVRGVRLARNFGHQAAVGAGLDHVSGDAVIVLDADLQDPPSLIDEMLAKWRQGHDVVYAQRTGRRGESLFKKITGHLFYRLLDRVNEVPIPRDTGDFALMDARVVALLRQFREHGPFWRGLRCWTGAKQTAVKFERPARAGGQTKYTFRKMARLAADGLLSFSSLPLRMPLYLGAALMVISILATAVCFGWWLLAPGASISAVAPWLLVLYLASAQFFCLGVMGEYIHRIYAEVRDRPRWVVRSTIGFTDEAQSSAESRKAA
ncbi:MAG: glycosyltransferase family 2 protein [Planctomycetia bacterium]|nr:glycosyltransferase family 2 protein [Planctomycetia bacterium]